MERIEANIHYPTDWILLRDSSLTLLKAGAEIEFGNGLFLTESPGGFIRDDQPYRATPPR